MMGGGEGYRLVWFQHLHKAAGTLIVNLAEVNGETLYPSHANGNPKDEDGEVIPLWEFDAELLSSFIDNCESQGVTFVATEHGAPDYSVLAADPRVFLISCMREPLKRGVANHNYAYYSGYTDAATLEEFVSEANVHMSDEYYVRMFSRREQLPLAPIEEDDYMRAMNALSGFDLILSTEHMVLRERLSESLGWSELGADRHATFGDGWKAWNMLKRLQLGRLVRYLRKRDASESRAALEGRFDMDYRLMDELFGD
ncbi:hypothetical protein [Candidatus Thalassarchaeum betae]|jgi:hypothetical protein|uniref:hypothetical protein n=1 Tax=Candidatus Thalassarchaeum betae TaxID=2599289 RepID=UPI0030C6D222|nr:hypothetical protein [Candidatus Thalassoarchaea betae]